MPPRDHAGFYDALSVDPDASSAQIKHSYRRLMKLLHPDVSKDPLDREQYFLVAAAYEVLKDPERRLAYDIESRAVEAQAEIELAGAAERERVLSANYEQLQRETLAEALDRGFESAGPEEEEQEPQRPIYPPYSRRRPNLAARRALLVSGVAATIAAIVVSTTLFRDAPKANKINPKRFPVPVDEKKRKVAVVIGNSNYAAAERLRNAVADATAIADALTRIGFACLVRTDVSRTQFGATFAQALNWLADDGIFVFYYAGHGLQIDGMNYLVPAEADVRELATARLDLVEVQPLVDMVTARSTAVFFLDSCRDNPFADDLVDADKSASTHLGRGLAPMGNSGGRTLFAFATGPEQIAKDGRGAHSPFAEALLRHLEDSSLEIQQLMTRVKSDVFAATRGEQSPWHTSNLLKDVYLTAEIIDPAS